MKNKLTVAYIRVSTNDQNIVRQTRDDVAKSYIDHGVSGAVPFKERPQAKKLLLDCEKGLIEEIKVAELTRLGRNLIDVLQQIEYFKDLGITVYSEKEGIKTLDPKTKQIPPLTKMIISMMGAFAEMELDSIRYRQEEGIKRAKALKIYKGRAKGSKVPDEVILRKYPALVNQLNAGLSVYRIAKDNKVSEALVRKIRNILGIEINVTKMKSRGQL